MAYDIFTGKVTTRNWSRESSAVRGESMIGSWITDKLTGFTMSKVPWKPILIVAGVLAGLFVFPRMFGKVGRRKDAELTKKRVLDDWVDEPTVQLTPHGKHLESMRELLGRNRAA